MHNLKSQRIGTITVLCGLLLGTFITPARAQTTIISVTGPDLSGFGIFPGQTVAFSFSVSQPYVDVTISAALVGVFTGTAFLMNSIGPETTTTNEIARAPFASNAPFDWETCCERSLLQPVLRHVTLPASGTYIVVFSTQDYSVPQGLARTDHPTIAVDAGASNGGLFVSSLSDVNYAYPPAGSFWEYSQWPAKIQVVGIPALMAVTIDLKPGSFPNRVNLGASSVIPVAILSTPSFNAPSETDVTSLTLSGASVKIAGASGRALCSVNDVNHDGTDDLLCYFDSELEIALGDTTVFLQGKTFSGRIIRGEDSIAIVPE